MSTEATGDGRPETADAIEPAAGAAGAVSAAPPAGESDELDEPGESDQSGEPGKSEDYGEYADDEAPEFAVDEGLADEAELDDDGHVPRHGRPPRDGSARAPETGRRARHNW